MKVAIIANADKIDGGSYTYERNILNLVTEFKRKSEIEFIVFNIRANFKTKIEDFFSFLRSTILGYTILKFLRLNLSYFEKKLIEEDFDLIYFVSPNPKALGIKMLPIITTVWDLGHRDLPQFPETGLGGNFELREYFLERTVIKSFRVICDSEVTKNKISKIYGVEGSRIFALGLPLNIDDEKFRNKSIFQNEKKEKYFVYPANFWKHKNHLILLEAFKIFLNYYSDTKLLFIGSDKGNLGSIIKQIRRVEIEEYVKILGYVKESEKNEYLFNSIAILMPTLLGPTNYPIYEGILMGKKVIASNVHSKSCIQESGSQICFVNPFDPDEWASEMVNARTKVLNLGFRKYLMESEIKNKSESFSDFFISIKRNLMQ
jgi:glycosyltransferase involved in cell wall biosynthesis